MKNMREIGNLGEDIAEKYLKKRFWRILSRNFSVRGGEIDIIGYRFGVLAFFEVKARSTDDYGTPASAVDDEKIAKIKFTANAFLKTYQKGNKIPVFYPFGIGKMQKIRKKRIDVIEVYFDKDYKLLKTNHLKDRESKL
jgi:putative endonuclease